MALITLETHICLMSVHEYFVGVCVPKEGSSTNNSLCVVS